MRVSIVNEVMLATILTVKPRKSLPIYTQVLIDTKFVSDVCLRISLMTIVQIPFIAEGGKAVGNGDAYVLNSKLNKYAMLFCN